MTNFYLLDFRQRAFAIQVMEADLQKLKMMIYAEQLMEADALVVYEAGRESLETVQSRLYRNAIEFFGEDLANRQQALSENGELPFDH